MSAGTLNIEGKTYRIVPVKDYRAMQAAWRREKQQAAEDRTDVDESMHRLANPREKQIPWPQVKKRAGLA